MSAKTLSSIAEEYFYSINPLAQRIGQDVAATKEAYEGLWNALSSAERNQAIDETIIQPEVALKYTLKKVEPAKDVPECFPKLRIQTGMKYVIDDTGSTLRWRDEHSAPFSFMTQSQMNLSLSDSLEDTKLKPLNSYVGESSHFASPLNMQKNVDSSVNDNYGHIDSTPNQLNFYQTESFSNNVFGSGECTNLLSMDSENSDNIFTKLINKTSLLKIQNNLDDDMESLVPQKSLSGKNSQKTSNSDKNQMNISLVTGRTKSNEIDESTALLETPSSYSSFQSSQLNEDDGIPKTGFEFLDNW
ncbi:uncharacterized protein C1orf198 homolog [Cephus cinctus]|uniref:Uncharacterized protein C1orf198 homolog n=1 Tax=Cephus cinctus TaxID=211228 RepID=A0AAJ7BHW2_CEPCN|nr:uncharacterized protein C1orf198 homolog [Cephus cinctus]XP_015586391.1 uncharacterized protein C1orf198 homolog [Cephus cinctus]